MADVYNLGFGGMNPYTQNAVNSTMNDMARNYNLIAKPQDVNSMVNSGSFGNSGLQQIQQNNDYNQLQNMGNVAANMQNNAYLGQQQFGLQAQNQLYNQQMGNQNYNLAADNQKFGQGMANKQFDLGAQNQSFNQGLATNQNAFSQDLANRNYGLNANQQNFNQDLANRNFGLTADQQRFNQDFTNRNFDANQYWTGQNFDAGQYNQSFNQQQQQLQNYMAMMGMANTFGNQDIANATQIQNAPLDYQTAFTNMANSIGGYGGTTSQTQNQQGNPLLGLLGGWSLGSSIAKG